MPSRSSPASPTGFRAELADPAAAPLDGLGAEDHACVALAVRPGEPDPAIVDPAAVLSRLDVDALAALRAERATGEAGQVVSVPTGRAGVDRLLLVGVGDGDEPALRKASAAATRRAAGADRLISGLAAGAPAAAVRAVAEAAGLASYQFSRRTEPPKQPPPQRLHLLGVTDGAAGGALDRAMAVVDAVRFARDLINTPSLDKTPDWLAEQARRAGEAAGLRVQVRDEGALAAEGFGGVLAVGAGSSRPPRLVQMEYAPAGARRHVVLIGKGITFDAGGLSLKPNESMVAMKTDMAGAAAVIATMTALGRLGVGARVTAIAPLAENLPSGSATRPGDVVRHWGGHTSEVLNTDAEGRLVLADALAYSAATLHPDVMVDLATLTGAATLGLGRRDAPLYATSDDLRDGLVNAGRAAGERVWPMPLVEDYRPALESPIADQRNIADPRLRFSGGSIVAALFLRAFTGGVDWAHLDIAGTGRADSDDGELSKGGTGFGVRLLCRWLEGFSR